MKVVALALVVVAFLLSPDPASAMKPIIKSPLSGVSVWPSSYSHQGIWIVHFGAAGSNSGAVRIRCEGAVLADGDSVLTVLPNRDNGWALTWKRINEGPVRMLTSLHAEGDDQNSFDEYTHLVVAKFRHLHDDVDTVLIQEFRTVKAIAVRDGKRFRCDGDFLVALDNDEGEESPKYRRRARVRSQSDIHCPDCHLTESTDVRVVATVGAKGKVTWARPYEEGRVHGYPYGPRVDPLIWTAAERGLQTFHYQPARSVDGPVSDYVVFTIHVVP